ncbi:hypothetical protein [Vandammella animalimorsus]|uniref:hypothetical protein n=1 Tax=Vandammella animalimorsus TaxID=2029117 RepID=UPI0011C3B654|nr:hypothetical protein [Vandammella animalimorsus]
MSKNQKTFAPRANSRMIAPLRENGAAGFGDLIQNLRRKPQFSSAVPAASLSAPPVLAARMGGPQGPAGFPQGLTGSPTRPSRRPHLAMGASVSVTANLGGQP